MNKCSLIYRHSITANVWLYVYTVQTVQCVRAWVKSLCCLSMLACVTLVTVGVTLVTNSSLIHCTCPEKRGYCKCNSVSPCHPTLSGHPSIPVTCPSYPHSSIHLPPLPHPAPHSLCLPLGLKPSIFWKKPNVPPFSSPSISIFRCVGGLNEHSLSPCLAKKVNPFFVALSVFSAMLVFFLFFFLHQVQEMCECPSQLPRTQPVHITAKRHKLGSQGMREVQIAFSSGLSYATHSRSSAAWALWQRLEQTMAASSLSGFVLCPKSQLCH